MLASRPAVVHVWNHTARIRLSASLSAYKALGLFRLDIGHHAKRLKCSEGLPIRSFHSCHVEGFSLLPCQRSNFIDQTVK